MPIDLCSSIKKTSQFAFSSPILNNILGSSIFVAFIIAIVMMLLIMILYPAKNGTPFSVVGKMFIYMFFITLLIVFLHDGVIKYMIEEEEEEKSEIDFMKGATLDGRDVVYGQTPLINPTLQTVVTSPQPSPQPSAQSVVPLISSNQVVKGSDPSIVSSYIDGGRERLGGARVPVKSINMYK